MSHATEAAEPGGQECHDAKSDRLLADFGLLQRCFRGPDVPVDPSCAG